MAGDDLVAICGGHPRLARHEALLRHPIETDPPELLRTRWVIGLQLSAPGLGVYENTQAVVTDDGDGVLQVGGAPD